MILAPDPLTHTRDLVFILDFSLSPPHKMILNPLDSFSGSPFPCHEPCLHPAVSCNAPDFPKPSLLDDNSWQFPFKNLVNDFSISFWVKSAQTSENQVTSSMQPHGAFPSHFSLFSFESQSRFCTPPSPSSPTKIQFTFPDAFSFLLDFHSVWNVSPFVQMLPVLQNWPKCYFLHEAFPDLPIWGHLSLLQVSWRPWTRAGPCGALLGTKTFFVCPVS